MTLKVISYNIREGGDGRLPAIAHIPRQQEPDVVALLEASSLANVEVLGHELGLEVAYGEANNPIGHIAWLGSVPIALQKRSARSRPR